MTRREIPRSEWRQQLDLFSREHDGTPARLEIRGSGGARTEARDLAFQGAAVDSPVGAKIEISLGSEPGDHITHEIEDAVSVVIEDGDPSSGRLEVRSSDGSTTTLELSPGH